MTRPIDGRCMHDGDVVGTVEGMKFTDEQVQRALERMRAGALKAHRDSGLITGPLGEQAQNRMLLFAQAAADLAGTSVQAEMDRAAGVAPEPAWAMAHPA